MKKLRLGLVGINFGKHWVERDIRNGNGGKYAEIAAVCDRREEAAKAYAAQLGCRCAAEIGSLLSDPEIDGIVLMTPPAGRAGLVGQCIHAGKPVLTTKPFEEDAEAARAVLKLARERGAIVHLNSPAPVLPDDLKKIAEWRRQYELGRPIAARWENYARYVENADGGWYDSPELCPFSPVLRIGIYGINDLIRIFGEVEAVSGVQSRIFTGRPTPDNAELSLRFKNGGIASIFASFCIADGQPYTADMTVHFERGTIHRRFVGPGRTERSPDFTSVRLELNCLYQGKYRAEQAETDPERRSGSYLWKEFHEAVTGGKPLADETDPEYIVSAIKVVEEMKRLQKEIPEC